MCWKRDVLENMIFFKYNTPLTQFMQGYSKLLLLGEVLSKKIMRDWFQTTLYTRLLNCHHFGTRGSLTFHFSIAPHTATPFVDFFPLFYSTGCPRTAKSRGIGPPPPTHHPLMLEKTVSNGPLHCSLRG